MLAIGGQVEAKKGLSEGIADGPVLWLRAAGTGLDGCGAAPPGWRVSAMLCGALWATRHQPLWVAFALAAVAAQLWTHHKPYDEIVLLLLVLPATAEALARWRRGGGWRWLVPVGLLALTLTHFGVPRLLGDRGFAAFQNVVWLAAGIWVARESYPPAEVGSPGEGWGTTAGR